MSWVRICDAMLHMWLCPPIFPLSTVPSLFEVVMLKMTDCDSCCPFKQDFLSTDL